MILLFIKLPDFIKLTKQDNLEGEGVQGSIFSIRAIKPRKGKVSTGFKDLRSGKQVMEKTISFEEVF